MDRTQACGACNRGSIPLEGTGMDYFLIIYFFVGVIQDFLLTLNWRFIAKEKVLPASALSFIVTVLSFLVLYNILTQLDNNRTILAIVVYALGIASGTAIGIKVKIEKK